MFTNYLKIAFRNLSKSKVYVFINVLGLGLSLACAIVAYLSYDLNTHFDTFHEKASQVFRINSIRKIQGDEQKWGLTPLPLAEALAKDLPTIKNICRFGNMHGAIRYENKVFNESIRFSEPSFLEMFTFPLEYGDKNALKDKNKVILSNETAYRYFAKENPIGKEVSIVFENGEKAAFIVGAVAQNVPENSSLVFDVLLNYENYYTYQKKDRSDWSVFANLTFVQLSKPEQIKQVIEQANKYIPLQNGAALDSWKMDSFYAEPLLNMAQKAPSVRNALTKAAMPAGAMLTFFSLALLIFLASCFNYTNTTIVFSNKRLKEISVRKVLGGKRSQLVVQFMGEHLIICVLALVLSLGIAELLSSAWNQMGFLSKISIQAAENKRFIFFLFGLLLFTCIVAGSYPALYITSFQPVDILKGTFKFKSTSWFARTLLVFQFSISLITMVASFAFIQNAYFLKNVNLGYTKEDLISIEVSNPQNFRVLKNALANQPNITHISGGYSHLGGSAFARKVKDQQTEMEAVGFAVEDNYLVTTGLQLKEGRDFIPNSASDRKESVIVNETLVKEFQWDRALGKQIQIDTLTFSVIGVVKDFASKSLFAPIAPHVIMITPEDKYRYTVIKAENGKAAQVYAEVEKIWNELFPDLPFSASYQADVLYEEMKINGYIRQIFTFLGFIALFLASNGLFAMTSLSMMQKMKEIAVRKVFGASLKSLIKVTNQDLVVMLIIAIIIGISLAYFGVKALISMIYSQHITSFTPAIWIASILLCLVAISTVAYRVYKAIRANPTEVLKIE